MFFPVVSYPHVGLQSVTYRVDNSSLCVIAICQINSLLMTCDLDILVHHFKNYSQKMSIHYDWLSS